jgi:hypothetical protein
MSSPARRPSVTVLMPVHDGAPFLRPAVESILGQTWRDLELLVIDDGSRDESVAIVQSYRDPRVRLHRHDGNRGLVATLNEGLELARSEYVARMDADDVAHPERLARQVEHLERHPAVAVLGTAVRDIGKSPRYAYALPCDHDAIRARLLFDWAIAHPTVMLRPAVLRDLGLRYDAAYPHAEDYALWVELAARARVANLPEQLLQYRHHDRQVSAREREDQNESMRRVWGRALALAGVEASDEEAALHREVATARFEPTPEFLDRAERWLLRIRDEAGRVFGRSAGGLDRELAQRWARICRRSRALGLHAWRRFSGSELRRGAGAVRSAEVLLGALAASGRRRCAVEAPPHAKGSPR